MFADLFVFGEPAALQLGVDELAVDAHFEPSAVGRDEDKTLNPGFEFRDELFGQADRLRFIVSRLAVDEFDFHQQVLSDSKGFGFQGTIFEQHGRRARTLVSGTVQGPSSRASQFVRWVSA